MKLSLITINRNNAAGLEKTMQSVICQTSKDFEYVVVDGASVDGSVKVIDLFAAKFGERMKWLSESDKGIYNAINKGILISSGDYVQILNSGDCLAANDVVEQMLRALEDTGNPAIIYGNMIKCFPNGKHFVDRGFSGCEITMLGMYSGTLNHDPALIRRDLFEKYGYYDENLMIVSDWKWYLQAIVLGGERPKYVDLNVTLFDMTGISERLDSKQIIREERNKVMEDLIPAAFLEDYKQYANDIYIMQRIRRHPWVYKVVWFVERCLFKYEKLQNNKNIKQ